MHHTQKESHVQRSFVSMSVASTAIYITLSQSVRQKYLSRLDNFPWIQTFFKTVKFTNFTNFDTKE